MLQMAAQKLFNVELLIRTLGFVEMNGVLTTIEGIIYAPPHACTVLVSARE